MWVAARQKGHHGERLPSRIAGITRSVEAVRCRFAPTADDGHRLYPVAGTAVLTSVARAETPD